MAERRMADTCLAFTSMAFGPPLPPYSTAGTCPVARTRRAAFLPRVSRGVASTMICSINPSSQSFVIALRPGLEKQVADRAFLVNRVNAAGQQFGNAEHLDLGNFFRGLGKGHGIGDNHFVDARIADALDGRAREHGVGAAGVDFGRAFL